jgi:hypothetical protein
MSNHDDQRPDYEILFERQQEVHACLIEKIIEMRDVYPERVQFFSADHMRDPRDGTFVGTISVLTSGDRAHKFWFSDDDVEVLAAELKWMIEKKADFVE